MPTISADALKRMLNLPANVVAVPVRPYAGDMDRCARCGSVAGRTTVWACAAGGTSTSAARGSCWSTRPGGSIARSTG